MNEDKFFDLLKEKYETLEPPIHLKLYGWQHILTKIGSQEKPSLRIVYRLALAGTLVLILAILSLGVYKTALAAIPGSPLYPIKLLSESLVNKINGNNQATIDNRAGEIVTIAKENSQNSQALKTVVREYTQSIESASVKGPSFEKKLEDQHRQFDNVIQEVPQVEKDIKDAIDASQVHDNTQEHGRDD